ncbi:hypothetical protein GE09DRAFT_685847 [Coniochaeta sp. 2T2.1]|nr:hypothetical protein GE09DRAFT_685847 [Coniochaeta sp. 2T2.1]
MSCTDVVAAFQTTEPTAFPLGPLPDRPKIYRLPEDDGAHDGAAQSRPSRRCLPRLCDRRGGARVARTDSDVGQSGRGGSRDTWLTRWKTRRTCPEEHINWKETEFRTRNCTFERNILDTQPRTATQPPRVIRLVCSGTGSSLTRSMPRTGEHVHKVANNQGLGRQYRRDDDAPPWRVKSRSRATERPSPVLSDGSPDGGRGAPWPGASAACFIATVTLKLVFQVVSGEFQTTYTILDTLPLKNRRNLRPAKRHVRGHAPGKSCITAAKPWMYDTMMSVLAKYTNACLWRGSPGVVQTREK